MTWDLVVPGSLLVSGEAVDLVLGRTELPWWENYEPGSGGCDDTQLTLLRLFPRVPWMPGPLGPRPIDVCKHSDVPFLTTVHLPSAGHAVQQ